MIFLRFFKLIFCIDSKQKDRTTYLSSNKSIQPDLPVKKQDSGKSLEKIQQLQRKVPCSANKNERNSSINENKARQSTSRSKCVEGFNSPPQTRINKTTSKKSLHINGRSLKHDISTVDINQQNNTPSVLNTSQALINTPLNRSLNFSKNPIFATSPGKFNSNNNIKEHIRTKTQSSAIETEIKTERHQFFQQKRKSLLKNNSSSNIFERSGLKKLSCASYKKSKEQSVNVKKINLIAKNDESHNRINGSCDREASISEFEKPLFLNKKVSNFSSDGYADIEKEFESPLQKKRTLRMKTNNNFLQKYKKKIQQTKILRKERRALRKKLKILDEKRNSLLNVCKRTEEKKEMVNQGIKSLLKENISLKIALDFLNLFPNKTSLSFDFLMKTPGIIVPTTDFRVFYDRILGTGGFGSVYEGVFSNKKVAIKVMRIPIEYLKMILKEIITMIVCEHPNLVKLYAVSFGQTDNSQVTIFIIMECLKQDLKNLIFKERVHLPQKIKYKILTDILKGLSYLHESHYVHCDLKLQNILIDEHFNAKITDFGLTNCLRFGNTKNTNIIGYSERTSAFEYLCEQKISTKGDIWSFGILMYELLYEKTSWEPLNGLQVVAKVSLKTPFFDYNKRSGNKFEENIIENCLNYNYIKRPTSKELLNLFELTFNKNKA